MFNTHGLSKDIVNDVAKVLNENKNDFGIPDCFLDPAKNAAKELSSCLTLEDKRNMIAKKFLDAATENKIDYDVTMIKNFDLAVHSFYGQN